MVSGTCSEEHVLRPASQEAFKSGAPRRGWLFSVVIALPERPLEHSSSHQRSVFLGIIVILYWKIAAIHGGAVIAIEDLPDPRPCPSVIFRCYEWRSYLWPECSVLIFIPGAGTVRHHPRCNRTLGGVPAAALEDGTSSCCRVLGESRRSKLGLDICRTRRARVQLGTLGLLGAELVRGRNVVVAQVRP